MSHECEWCAKAPKIWNYIDLKETFSWEIKSDARAKLDTLISPESYRSAFGVCENARTNPRHAEWSNVDWKMTNIRIRPALAPYLLKNDETSGAVAKWIVYSWGGIRKNADIAGDWTKILGDYEQKNVRNFINLKGHDRIASWSKILAIADSKNYAIYDARVAVALNCALAAIQDARQFFMPVGRNKTVEEARKKLNGERRNLYGYLDYLKLLNCFVSQGMTENILEAEMVAFSNAERLAGAV